MRSPATPAALAGAIELGAAAVCVIALAESWMAHAVLGAAYQSVRGRGGHVWDAIGATVSGGAVEGGAVEGGRAGSVWAGADAVLDQAGCASAEVAFAAELASGGGGATASMATAVAGALVLDPVMFAALDRLVDDYDGKCGARWGDVAASLLASPPVLAFMRPRRALGAAAALACAGGAVLRALSPSLVRTSLRRALLSARGITRGAAAGRRSRLTRESARLRSGRWLAPSAQRCVLVRTRVCTPARVCMRFLLYLFSKAAVVANVPSSVVDRSAAPGPLLLRLRRGKRQHFGARGATPRARGRRIGPSGACVDVRELVLAYRDGCGGGNGCGARTLRYLCQWSLKLVSLVWEN